MAVSLLFKGTDNSETNQNTLELFANTSNEIYIKVEGDGMQHICLSKEDAIKLSKELKKQINIVSVN